MTPGTLLTITVGCRDGYGFHAGGPGGEGTQECGASGGGGGATFAHRTLSHGATLLPPGAGGVVIYPLWGLVACPTPPSSSTVPCYDVATASAAGPRR